MYVIKNNLSLSFLNAKNKRKKRFKMSEFQRLYQKHKEIIWAGLYIIIPLVLNFAFTQHSQIHKKFANIFVEWFALMLPVFIFPGAIKRYLWLLLILYPIYWINICHGILFGGAVSSISFQTIFDSNLAETLDFIKGYINWKIFAVTLVLFLPAIIILPKHFRHAQFSSHHRRNWIIFCSIMMVVLGYQALRPKYRFTPIKMATEYFTYCQDLERMIEIKNSRQIKPFKNIVSTLSADEPETYIVVIGESVDREHLQLYGYHRETTPNFSSYKEDLLIFNKINSPHSYTLGSLRKVLTFAHDDNLDPAHNSGSIINFFNDAGYKTFWLSNQYSMGDNDNIVAVYAQDAKEVEFSNTMNWQEMESKYDDVLLPSIQKAIKDPAHKKIIFVHLMGSHGRYENRYPNSFNKFNKYDTLRQRKVNRYDNSILYTDDLLDKIIKQLRKADANSYMLYFSDHGEDVYDRDDSCFCHSEDISSRHMFDIPFVLWLSDKYKALHPGLVKKLPGYVNRPFSTQHLIHSLPSLSGLSQPNLKPEHNLFSPRYNPDQNPLPIIMQDFK